MPTNVNTRRPHHHLQVPQGIASRVLAVVAEDQLADPRLGDLEGLGSAFDLGFGR